MKNKKLFAILTLVCFMMTLMPVAAFAAVTDVTLNGYDTNGDMKLDVTGWTTEAVVIVADADAAAATVDLSGTKKLATAAVTTGVATVAKANVLAANTAIVVAAAEADSPTATIIDKYDITATEVTASDLAIDTAAAVAVNTLATTFDAAETAYDADPSDAGKEAAYLAARSALISGYRALTDDQKALVAPTTLASYQEAVADASVVADAMSVVWTKDTKVDVSNSMTTDAAAFNLKVTDVNNPLGEAAADIYVWVTAEGSNIPVNTFKVSTDNSTFTSAGSYVYVVENVFSEDTIYVAFMSTGSFQVHVSAEAPAITNNSVVGASEFKSAGSVVKVTSNADDTRDYVITTDVGGTIYNANDVATGNAYLEDGDTESALVISANNVDEKVVTIRLQKPAGALWADVAGAKVDIEVVGAITTDKTTVYTNALGQAEFKVGGNRDGVYKIYLSTGKYESMIEVQVGAIIANSIESECETGKYDILGDTDLADVISFTMYDVNGNELAPVNDDAVIQGWDKAYYSYDSSYGTPAVDATGYVAIVEKPADSKLANEDLTLEMVDTNSDTKDDTLTIVLKNNATIDAEGVYTFKVVLNNGAFATATCDVKEFDKPVTLIINGADNVELGAVTNYVPIWIDANGVKDTQPKGVEIAATGYAVETFDGMTLETKSDEKYVGSVITLTAIDERNNLVATKEVTIAAEAQKLSFAADTAEVNVNNYIKVSVVDANGKVVALDGNVKDISYVVLEKPEGANVFVSTYKDYSAKNKNFVMNLTSNKVGTVKVQAVVKYETTTNTNKNEVANVVKYYTGIQEIAVGTGETGKSVVMSIGSDEMIAGNKVSKIDAKPMVQNNRTYVPFRALAEAFGATVAYDQEKAAVTAELNGVKVVMTVGDPVYTVNGVKNTADVAPFISDSRTFVPVRFAAEAFGIEVVPTYNEDGSVADVLFNM